MQMQVGAFRGLSPRRRGNRGGDHRCRLGSGSIPAQAGEPKSRSSRERRTRVYPRAGGGTFDEASVRAAHTGLSPRRRGNRVGNRPDDVVIGSIPAQAGEPRPPSTPWSRSGVYPRAGGGTVQGRLVRAEGAGLSPRRRGNLAQSLGIERSTRSIPAQAGEPGRRAPRPAASRVYPRAGGGTAHVLGNLLVHPGLSPRRRGNPLLPTP